jgi:NAD(P)-dependent dehydrogenase (short-subunit alcohol dehydrogenase family)
MPESGVALVTGGGRGLGLACARRLAEEGYGVALLDRNEAAARSELESLDGGAERHRAMGGDVTDRTSVEAALALTTKELGAPTVLINGAGILFPTKFLEISDEEWRSVIEVSLTGSFIAAQVCLQGMIDAGFGRIVNFSSTAGKNISTLGGAHYTAAKAGVLGLTRALANESAPHGVTVNAICPGLIDTDMARENCSPQELEDYAASFPVPRLGEPGEIAALVAFLCGSEAGYITGAALDINGGDLMV